LLSTSAYSALEVLHIMRYINLLTLLWEQILGQKIKGQIY